MLNHTTTNALQDETLLDVIRRPRRSADPDKQLSQNQKENKSRALPSLRSDSAAERVHRTEQVHSAADSEDVFTRVNGQ